MSDLPSDPWGSLDYSESPLDPYFPWSWDEWYEMIQ